MTITRHRHRFWRVEEDDGTLVCVTVFKKGAKEVVRRLSGPRDLVELARHASRHPLTADGLAETPRTEKTRTEKTRADTATKKKGEN